jgi:hypothetical protein
MDPRTGLDDVEKTKFLALPGLELRPLGHPARSQSLYRLSYPGSLLCQNTFDLVYLGISAFLFHSMTPFQLWRLGNIKSYENEYEWRVDNFKEDRGLFDGTDMEFASIY